VPVLQTVYGRMQGIVRMHNPTMVVSPLADIDAKVKEALRMAAVNGTALVLLPRTSVSKVLWMATLKLRLTSHYQVSTCIFASFAYIPPRYRYGCTSIDLIYYRLVIVGIS
jgi:hypothetical protein